MNFCPRLINDIVTWISRGLKVVFSFRVSHWTTPLPSSDRDTSPSRAAIVNSSAMNVAKHLNTSTIWRSTYASTAVSGPALSPWQRFVGIWVRAGTWAGPACRSSPRFSVSRRCFDLCWNNIYVYLGRGQFPVFRYPSLHVSPSRALP